MPKKVSFPKLIYVSDYKMSITHQSRLCNDSTGQKRYNQSVVIRLQRSDYPQKGKQEKEPLTISLGSTYIMAKAKLKNARNANKITSEQYDQWLAELNSKRKKIDTMIAILELEKLLGMNSYEQKSKLSRECRNENLIWDLLENAYLKIKEFEVNQKK